MNIQNINDFDFVVAIYADTLDTNPVVLKFDTEWEAQESAHDAIEDMTQWEVDHSPYPISEEERDQIEERNRLLVKLYDGINFKRTIVA